MKTIKITGTKLTKEVVQMLQFNGNKMVLSNVYCYDWESDVFCLSKHNGVSEYEIKVSVSDFNADFNKSKKHIELSLRDNEQMPNHFWYVVPKDLIDDGDVPEYAGLMYYMGRPGWFKIIKKAPALHKYQMSDGLWEEIAMKLYNKTL